MQASASWPSYGHDLANTRDAGADAPSLAEAGRLGTAWSFVTSKGGITATPVVAHGVVVAGSSHGTVYGLDARTGAVRWSRALRLPGYTYLTSSAAISGDDVYVAASSRNGPYLFDLRLSDGRVLWRRNLFPYQPFSDTYASPVVWSQTVYIGVSEVAAEEGDPTGIAAGAVFAMNAGTGALRWSVYTITPGYDGGGVWSSAAIDPSSGALYVGTGNAYRPPAAPTTDSILSIDAGTGDRRGWFSAVQGDVFRDHTTNNGPDADFGASPNLFAGPGRRPLVGGLTKSGVYWAVDRRDMSLVWSHAVGTHPEAVHSSLASTAYDGRRIYGMNDDGQVWALDTGGRQLWATNRDGSSNYSPLAVGNGALYSVNSEGVLNVRDASSGAALARIDLGARSWGGVSIAGRTVFAAVGTDRGRLGAVVALRPPRHRG